MQLRVETHLYYKCTCIRHWFICYEVQKTEDSFTFCCPKSDFFRGPRNEFNSSMFFEEIICLICIMVYCTIRIYNVSKVNENYMVNEVRRCN